MALSHETNGNARAAHPVVPSPTHPLTPSPSQLDERLARIELLLLDVDGVLTDGSIVYAQDGGELKTFHVRDGAGLKAWRSVGKKAGIITGRSSKIVSLRAAELGLDAVVQGAEAKLPAFRDVLERLGLGAAQVCYVGDDLPDLPVLDAAGLAVAVADACPEAIARAHYVAQRPGGKGAVREVIELILKSQGLWQAAIDRVYEAGAESRTSGARPGSRLAHAVSLADTVARKG
jgi:3-deoxy-D-manno-octulosonate 8-phosphate phosphatase (KDO 8-P phosphatase)